MENKIVAFAGTCLIALFTALCMGPTQATAQQTPKEIVIGYSLSLTGKFSTEAAEVHRAYRLWADEVNERGGIEVKDAGRKLPVRLLHYDDSSDTNNAIRNYERLITKDEVNLLFSPWGSGHNFAISALTEKYRFPIILATAAADRIFQRNFKYIFETTQLASKMYDALVDYFGTVKGRVNTVAIAYENFLFTQSLHDVLKPKLEASGFQIVADEQYPMAAQDFTSMLTRIKAARPDAFLLINIMPSSVYVTRQMNEIDFKPKLYAVNIGPMYQDEFIDKLGPITEGIIENGFWSPDLPYEGARKFFDAYVAKYHREPSTDSAYPYIAAQILQQAVEQAGTLNREKVAQTLHAARFNSILGPYEYDEHGVNKHQMVFLCQVQDGKRVTVWPKQVAKAMPRLPN